MRSEKVSFNILEKSSLMPDNNIAKAAAEKNPITEEISCKKIMTEAMSVVLKFSPRY